MRKLFRHYIVAGAVFGLTQYALLDPWFSGDHGRAVTRAAVPGPGSVRVALLCPRPALVCGGDLAVLDEHVQPGRRRSSRPRRRAVCSPASCRSPTSPTRQLRRAALAVRPRHVARAAARPAARSVRDRRRAGRQAVAERADPDRIARVLRQLHRRAPAARTRRDAVRRRRPTRAGPERWLVLPSGCAGRRTGARWRWASAPLAWLLFWLEDRSRVVGHADVPGRLPGAQVVAGRAVTASTHRRLSRS